MSKEKPPQPAQFIAFNASPSKLYNTSAGNEPDIEKCQLLYPDVKFHGEFHVADNIALANKKTISDPKKFE
ncbi:hypothetical protein DVH24_011681 [Malus domestica]|uniref:Uncharacterized protein n=1 Tax=Malus domestica TaxID=3750 RepID=A0A498JW92_MALDO|nr:hypothetical protein DVH24_011681 [Malus domestica]